MLLTSPNEVNLHLRPEKAQKINNLLHQKKHIQNHYNTISHNNCITWNSKYNNSNNPSSTGEIHVLKHGVLTQLELVLIAENLVS